MENNIQKPTSNLVWAILVTCFCCLPLGVVAIVYAIKVDDLWKEGKYEAAKEAAEKAKGYSLWGVIGGLVFFVIYFCFFFMSMLTHWSV